MSTDPEPQHDALDLEAVREIFEASADFTVGIEEEFAIVDPAILDLEHRFEEMKAACLRDPELAPSVKGELIDTEIEIRSGRGETFADAADRQRARRARLFAIADEMGLALAAMGTHPWANYLDQRIIDTEHYRRLEQDLRWVAQRNNTWSLHVHVGVRGPDRAVAVSDRMRELLPPLLALSANSPFLDHRDTGLHTVRTEIFTRTFPRCGVHEPFGDWRTYADFVQLLEDTDSVAEATQLWWSVRPHHAFGTVEVRICDAQSSGDESLNLATLIAACVVQVAIDLDEGRSPSSGGGFPGRLGTRQREIEENLWRAIRYGMDGEMIDFRDRRVIATRQVLEELVEWTGPARQTLGVDVELPERNGAQRAYARFAEGAPIEEIYRRSVEETRRTYAPEGAVSGR
ncbi:MAG TPA: YbdK family carboxylate-amine ligase [Solirubrobacterales bacterium]|nr:YbdK family carboxylate-amine ligase [Solirubrobacterales bacterium]